MRPEACQADDPATMIPKYAGRARVDVSPMNTIPGIMVSTAPMPVLMKGGVIPTTSSVRPFPGRESVERSLRQFRPHLARQCGQKFGIRRCGRGRGPSRVSSDGFTRALGGLARQSEVIEQDRPNFLDGLSVLLHTVIATDHDLRFDAVKMGTDVRDDPVAGLVARPWT